MLFLTLNSYCSVVSPKNNSKWQEQLMSYIVPDSGLHFRCVKKLFHALNCKCFKKLFHALNHKYIKKLFHALNRKCIFITYFNSSFPRSRSHVCYNSKSYFMPWILNVFSFTILAHTSCQRGLCVLPNNGVVSQQRWWQQRWRQFSSPSRCPRQIQLRCVYIMNWFRTCAEC